MTASTLAPHAKESQPDRVIRRPDPARRAARNLQVMVLSSGRGARGWGWRDAGPVDPEAWWRSYSAFILHFARPPARARRGVLGGLGAGLHGGERAGGLIAEVRATYPGQLSTRQLGSLRRGAVLGRPRLHQADGLHPDGSARSQQAELTAAWGRIRDTLVPFVERVGRPLVFTELGYVSQDGVASAPWDYTRERRWISRSSGAASPPSWRPGRTSRASLASSSGTGGGRGGRRIAGTH
ncbi:MAG: hypothetical protein R3F43_06310 [bacterium]